MRYVTINVFSLVNGTRINQDFIKAWCYTANFCVVVAILVLLIFTQVSTGIAHMDCV